MDKVVGNCSKHPGQNFVNCPLCEIERQRKLSLNFWENVQKDFDRVNPTPGGVTAEEIIKPYLFFDIDGMPTMISEGRCLQAMKEYASLKLAEKEERATTPAATDAPQAGCKELVEALRWVHDYYTLILNNDNHATLAFQKVETALNNYKQQNP